MEKEYIIIEKDLLLEKMAIVEKVVKKHALIVKADNPFLKYILVKKKPG